MAVPREGNGKRGETSASLKGLGSDQEQRSPRTRVLITGGLARKDKWLCARAGQGRSVSPWGTSHCPNCKMKVVPLPPPGHSRGHLQGHLTGLTQARDGPFLSTSPLMHSPQNFSGIYYYYYKDAETQQVEEIFLTIIFDPKSGALRK